MKRIVIVGAGPAGLMAAQHLMQCDAEILVYDAKKVAGRKFLVAGHGGFNLSHEGDLEKFQSMYDHPYIKHAVDQFGNNDTVNWLKELGIPTYVGTSGKIFPLPGIKPIQVLNCWLEKLREGNIRFHFERRLIDFDAKRIIVESPEGREKVTFDYLVCALGGASWKQTGSDGLWLELFQKRGVATREFEASNAGMNALMWNAEWAGQIVKNVRVEIGSRAAFGEVLLTDYGLEGAPIYALNREVREGHRTLFIDLKPHNTAEQLVKKLHTARGNRTAQLKALKLTKAVIALLKETLSKEDYLENDKLVACIKALPITVEALRPIDEAISTVGGIRMEAVDASFQLTQLPNVFCIGEMLDWDAPTGGYLLQANFASGYVAATAISEKINRSAEG